MVFTDIEYYILIFSDSNGNEALCNTNDIHISRYVISYTFDVFKDTFFFRK